MKEGSGVRYGDQLAHPFAAPVLLVLVPTVGLALYLPPDQPRLAALVLTVASALAVAWTVSHLMIVRPTKQLVAAARRLGRGDLGARTGLRRGSDEIAELAATFDEMAAALQARELALKAARADRERRVDERTTALRRANEQLRYELAERRRAEDETLAALRRAEMLLTTSGALNDGSTEEAVRQIIVDSAASLVDGSAAVLWMTGGGPELRGVAATAGLTDLVGQRGPWWEGAAGADTARVAGSDIASLSAVVPLMIGPSLLGMVSIHHSTARPPSPQEHTLLRAFANHAATALRNIRLREELAQSLTSLAARTRLLEDKTREQEVFIYTVAHDLKAPLVSLQGLTSILVADYGDRLDAEGQRYLERIIANAEKLQGLIRDLLEIARVGRVDADRQAIDLGAIVTDVVDQLRHTLDARGAVIAVEHPLPTIWANPTRMAQVFSNLINNAATYTPPERTPHIAIRVAERPDEWEIAVADNGIGVPAAMQERIFGVFQRLPGAKALNPHGSGVGLTIVARIIETHGGQYWLVSEEGAGTTFTFTLPRPTAMATPTTTLVGVAD
jgi:signal transduction histidine kinase